MAIYIFLSVYSEMIKLVNKFLPIYLDIGSGDVTPSFGWTNLDASSGVVFNESFNLPFRDNSVDFIYASQIFEHLDDATVNSIIIESFRVLKSKSILRVVGPDQSKFINMYKRGEFEDLASYLPACDLKT